MLGPGFDSMSPAKGSIRFASHRMGNLVGTTEKSGTVGAVGKAGWVDTICISLLRDVGPTAKKLYLSDRISGSSVTSVDHGA